MRIRVIVNWMIDRAVRAAYCVRDGRFHLGSGRLVAEASPEDRDYSRVAVLGLALLDYGVTFSFVDEKTLLSFYVETLALREETFVRILSLPDSNEDAIDLVEYLVQRIVPDDSFDKARTFALAGHWNNEDQ